MPSNPLFSSQRPVLNALVLPLLFIALAFVIFRQDLLVINDLWLNNHSNDLGYPALAISLFLSYQSWANKPAYRWSPPVFLLLAGLLGALALYILADATILQAPRLLAFVLIFIFFIAINVPVEQRFGQILVFAILLYTIPIWGVLTNLLQFLTVKATSTGLDIARIPASIHGYYISLPGGTLEVEEGCSGLRYLVTTLLICHIFCLLNRVKITGWIVMFAAGTLLALIANWVRVYILAHLAYTTDLQHPWIHDHESLGWAVYIFIYIPLFFISGFILNKKTEQQEFSFFESFTRSGKKTSLVLLLLSCVLMITPYLVMTVKQSGGATENISFTQPTSLDLCYLSPSKPEHVPKYTGFSQIFSAVYDCTEGKTETHYLVYNKQTQGKELINVFNTLLDSETWQEVHSERITGAVEFSLDIFADNKGKYAVTAKTYIVDDKASTSAQLIRSTLIKKGLLKDISMGMASSVMMCKTDCTSEAIFMKDFFADYTKYILETKE
jgi:exosortase